MGNRGRGLLDDLRRGVADVLSFASGTSSGEVARATVVAPTAPPPPTPDPGAPPRARWTSTVNLARRETCEVYIGRASSADAVPEGTPGSDGRFGNPCVVGEECPECGATHEFPGDTLACFRTYFDRRVAGDENFKAEVEGLRGKRLGCFCSPNECHGDVYVEYLHPASEVDEGEAIDSIAKQALAAATAERWSWREDDEEVS